MFDALDALVDDGAIAAYGVSVERPAQALTAIARPGVATVQIIFNAFRLKPLDEVLPAASDAGVGIIARVPLASGLLTGRYSHDTKFAANDHRTYNRHGEAFDAGETFPGSTTTRESRRRRSSRRSPRASGSLRRRPHWRGSPSNPASRAVIPGARNQEQAVANAAAASVPPLGPSSRPPCASSTTGGSGRRSTRAGSSLRLVDEGRDRQPVSTK